MKRLLEGALFYPQKAEWNHRKVYSAPLSPAMRELSPRASHLKGMIFAKGVAIRLVAPPFAEIWIVAKWDVEGAVPYRSGKIIFSPFTNLEFSQRGGSGIK